VPLADTCIPKTLVRRIRYKTEKIGWFRTATNGWSLVGFTRAAPRAQLATCAEASDAHERSETLRRSCSSQQLTEGLANCADAVMCLFPTRVACVRVTEAFCHGHGGFYPAAALLDQIVALIERWQPGSKANLRGVNSLVGGSPTGTSWTAEASLVYNPQTGARSTAVTCSRGKRPLLPERISSANTPFELVQARFREIVRPPCDLVLRIERHEDGPRGRMVFVTARSASRLVADVCFMLPAGSA